MVQEDAYGSDIKIMQRWRVRWFHITLLAKYINYHDWNDNLSYGYIADGRGGHRNYYWSQEVNGLYTNTNDKKYVNYGVLLSKKEDIC